MLPSAWDESKKLRGATQFRRKEIRPFAPRLVGPPCDFGQALYARSGNVLPKSICAGFQPVARSLWQMVFRYCFSILALVPF